VTRPLAEITTLRVGGPPRRLVTVDNSNDLVDAVRSADRAGEPILILGGGSNVVVADDGFAGTVILVRTRGIDVSVDSCAGAWIQVQAGEPWDELVAGAIAEEWSGVEALSGIPGLTGATPIQNVGAYGQEVSDTIARVTAYDRHDEVTVTMPAAECAFGYRHSRFKAEPERFVVLSVTYQLPLGSLSAPIRYSELASRLGVQVGERAPSADVRAAVLDLRGAKAMVLDADDHDTWSVGSFFTNPIVDEQSVPAGAPRWSQDDGSIKTSAAWLVENAGFSRGYPGHGPARLSTRHTLAITNRGSATTQDILELATRIRSGVREAFDIDLVPEPRLIGCGLD
jgi:UDP-N-acetylmuramate dehydrogenase